MSHERQTNLLACLLGIPIYVAIWGCGYLAGLGSWFPSLAVVCWVGWCLFQAYRLANEPEE